MDIRLSLKSWFLKNKRDFPWRKGCTPYAVWISEVMLQQTRAAVVVAYFTRWMERFPTLVDLAEAPFDEVLKAWEGLGYYSRARNLHRAAQQIVREHGAKIPNTKEALLSIPGIGHYTAGAILSFAFQKKGAAIDGNVKRVLARFFMIENEVNSKRMQEEIEEKLEYFLVDPEPHIVMEGLIELGAVICGRQPACFSCPIKNECLAYQNNRMNELPVKAKKREIQSLFRSVPIILYQNRVLLKKEREKKVMADLYEFPYMEIKKQLSIEEERDAIRSIYQIECTFVQSLPTQKHAFTRFRSTLFPSIWETKEFINLPLLEWIDLSEIEKRSFSSGHRRILAELLKEKQ